MTHLVEMQEAHDKLERAGMKLYAISYDDVDALAAFAEAQSIDYTMLSDANSEVIRSLGILNTNVAPHEVPFYGIPFPGTYVIDEDGRVVAKFFPRHITLRESVETFIDAAAGKITIADDEPQQVADDHDDVRVSVAFHGGDALRTGLQRRIVARFDLPEGVHIYGEPVPDGMVATTVDVSGPDGLVVEAPILPPTEPFEIKGMGAKLDVWSGVVDIVVPVWAESKLAPFSVPDGETPTATIDVRVRYQACDDYACRLPRTETFTFEIPIASGTTPRLSAFRGNPNSTTMSSTKHLSRMVRRSLLKRPWLALRSFRYLLSQRRHLDAAADRPTPDRPAPDGQ